MKAFAVVKSRSIADSISISISDGHVASAVPGTAGDAMRRFQAFFSRTAYAR